MTVPDDLVTVYTQEALHALVHLGDIRKLTGEMRFPTPSEPDGVRLGPMFGDALMAVARAIVHWDTQQRYDLDLDRPVACLRVGDDGSYQVVDTAPPPMFIPADLALDVPVEPIGAPTSADVLVERITVALTDRYAVKQKPNPEWDRRDEREAYDRGEPYEIPQLVDATRDDMLDDTVVEIRRSADGQPVIVSGKIRDVVAIVREQVARDQLAWQRKPSETEARAAAMVASLGGHTLTQLASLIVRQDITLGWEGTAAERGLPAEIVLRRVPEGDDERILRWAAELSGVPIREVG